MAYIPSFQATQWRLCTFQVLKHAKLFLDNGLLSIIKNGVVKTSDRP